jgi:hypothetical protein
MTPEGRIKQKVMGTFDYFGINSARSESKSGSGWYYMPVQNGLGVKGIPDFIGHYKGHFFAIETKAPGRKPTAWQERVGRSIQNTGGEWFVIDGDETLVDFRAWLRIIGE